MLLRLVFAHCLLAAQLAAHPLPGADDPAFALPFARALAGDDPTALTELHAAATAGNQAALLSLPAVLLWLPPEGPLPTRNRFRKIGDTRLDDAVAAASAVMADWQGGLVDTPADLPARALRLYAADERGKADTLIGQWLNQTGGLGDWPAGLERAPLPALFLGLALRGRLEFAPTPEDEARLIALLREDRPGAWLALAGLTTPPGGTALPDPAQAGLWVQRAGLAPDHAAARLKAAHLVRLTQRPGALPLSPEQAEALRLWLTGQPDFAPVEILCALHCPDSAAACARAHVAALGPLARVTEASVPPVAVIRTQDFLATPRGLRVWLSTLASSPGWADRRSAATAIDACFGDLVARSAP